MGYIGPAVHYHKGGEKDYYRRGILIARYVRDLEDGECPCGLEDDVKVFVDGRKVYRKV